MTKQPSKRSVTPANTISLGQLHEQYEAGILDKEYYENEKNIDINQILCVHLNKNMIQSFSRLSE